MTTIIEIAGIEPPKEGKSGKLGPGKVFTTSGDILQIWPKTMQGIQIGNRYQVELEETEFRGKKQQTVVKLFPPNDNAPRTMPITQFPISERGNKANPPIDSEPAFVAAIVAGFVIAGKVANYKELAEKTAMARRLFAETFINTTDMRRAG